MNDFLNRLFAAAEKEGISQAEAYMVERESFEGTTIEGEIMRYSSNATRGLGFRAMIDGRMGYASTEAFDEEAVRQLIRGVVDSARLCEDTDRQFLFGGDQPDPELSLFEPALEKVPTQQKLDFALEMEREAKAYDARVEKVGYNTVVSGKHTVRILNTLGLNKQYTENYVGAYLEPVAREGNSVSSGFESVYTRDMQKLDPKALAGAAAKIAVDGLNAAPVPSGAYRIIFQNTTMTDLLGVFAAAFSAENAQQGLSLLKGKLDQQIAAPCVTLADDPLLPEGLNSRPFDAEGVPSKKHTVIENGVFKTFLHNLKTAHKDGVPTTANASKAGYASSVRVSPSNFYFVPGEKSPQDLMVDAGTGLVITEVSGLHAGADAISGDFSLLSKGYLFENGRRVRPVEQITVAGNFFALLKGIRAMGNDLRFPGGGMGSPSMDVGELSVAGA